MRFEELLDRHERGHLTQGEAGEMLGVSERTFRRWQERYREEGAAGLARPADRQAVAAAGAAEGELARARGLYAEMYGGFTVKHFHEKLHGAARLPARLHGDAAGAAGGGAGEAGAAARGAPAQAAAPAAAGHAAAPGRRAPRLAGRPAGARPGGHARRRDERDLLGLPGGGGGHRLELPGAGRGDRRPGAVLRALHRPRQPLLPHARSPAAASTGEHPTQVGRALAQLGIEHIAAYSPQARGRSERLFRTLEDRLPKELALAGITEIDAANAWLRAVYLPAHNARFAVAAEEHGTAFVAGGAGAVARGALPPGDPPGRQRQHRALEGPQPADPQEPAPAPLRARERPPARIPRRRGRAVLGPAPHRRLPAARGGTR